MKNYNQYELSKNDKQLIKNFRTSTDFKILNQEETDYYWLKILDPIFDKRKQCLNELYANLRYMNAYVCIIYGKEYFIYDYYVKNVYNIFFYNITDNIETDLTTSKEHINLFSVLCFIIINDILYKKSLSYKIKLPTKNVKLYFKLIDKVIRLNTTKVFNVKRYKKSYFYESKIVIYNANTTFYTKRQLKEKYLYNRHPFVDRIKFLNLLKAKYCI